MAGALVSIGQAAGLLRVSPETVRRWAESGRLPALRAPDGTRAVDRPALAAFARERAAGLHRAPDRAAATSVRNSFAGIVTAVRMDEVAARPRVEIRSGPHRMIHAPLFRHRTPQHTP
ncbi:helix-turn-helix domain-containing protein [Streptomyces sp. NPDC001389]|uniref:helix-turn-helix domain-containing protein n=1 Tax=Streptomyces sp. NPDC001389 TaxID=3364569 RepID=UPI003691E2EB